MSWIEKLYQTYEQNTGRIGDKNDPIPLFPICHTSQNAHIEIVIDGEGNFIRTSVLDKDASPTIVPCTEESAGRSGIRPKNHPLCDKLQYLAGDFNEFGGEVTAGFSKTPCYPFEIYIEELEQWAFSEFTHPKVLAILKYIEKGKLIKDLIDHKVLHVEDSNSRKLAYEWTGADRDKPDIFKTLNGKPQKNGKRNPWQAEAFIRWTVEIPGCLDSSITETSLQKSWIKYYANLKKNKGLCHVEGTYTFLADSHPAKLRNSADKAKLISSNDSSGFTFRGRLTDSAQVAALSFEVTQKAHNAFRWLLSRQGKTFYVKSGGRSKPRLAIVAWAVSELDIPDPLADSDELLGDFFTEEEKTERESFGNIAQDFGNRFAKYISGYSVKLGKTDQIVVMGIDSATPGRMAVTYYRELTGSDFLQRVESWHNGCAWFQQFSSEKSFFGAPAPQDIAQVAYGTKDKENLLNLDDNLKKTTVERLLPCIIDGAPLPWDIVNTCIRKATQRQNLPEWAWEKTLGIACGLYRYHSKSREEYKMGLERERTTRDYLFGRLLAVADCMEGYALKLSNENRQTNATKLMQRFAERPCSTWRTIELALVPYKTRLSRGNKYEREIDIIHSLFTDISSYQSDAPLSGEFLLGFHCQRAELVKSKQTDHTSGQESKDEP